MGLASHALSQLTEAFELMYKSQVSGVAVLDSQGSLVGNLSGSDLRGIQQSEFENLLLPVKVFLKAKQPEEQRRLVVRNAQLPCYALNPECIMGRLLESFKQRRVHRSVIFGLSQ